MEIYQRYGPALLRKAERVLRNRDDAMDVVQGVFVDMLQKGQTQADLPYLYAAVTSRCLNHLRNRTTRARLLERQDPSLWGSPRTRCDEHMIGLDLLTKLVAQLDDSTLQVLIYKYFDDLSQEEIAQILDLSRKTIGKRLDRVRQAVIALTNENGPGGAP
jgi:RNA polymerase sigma-70 factor (ECF subfamily)